MMWIFALMLLAYIPLAVTSWRLMDIALKEAKDG